MLQRQLRIQSQPWSQLCFSSVSTELHPNVSYHSYLFTTKPLIYSSDAVAMDTLTSTVSSSACLTAVLTNSQETNFPGVCSSCHRAGEL